MAETAVLILAAGKGTRLKSQLPKVLHEAGGRTLLGQVMAAAREAGIPAADILVVAGYGLDRMRSAVEPLGSRLVVQEPQLGTGHAVQMAAAALAPYPQVLVLHGDMPLVSAATVRALLERLTQRAAAAVLATATPPQPRAYGRIVRQGERVIGIVEDRQCTAEQKQIRELNAGFYAFNTAALLPALERLGTANPHGEFYLTDTIALLAQAGPPVLGYELPDPDECLGINDRAELVQVDALLRRRRTQHWLHNGVTIYDPETVVIDPDVTIGPDTVLEPGVQLLGQTRIGQRCRIRSYSVLQDSRLGDDVLILPHCVVESAELEDAARIGPFTRLREGARIGRGAHLGNFVEVKKSQLGAGVKAGHLAYLGDATIGPEVNIGAGTITCNYDGVHKHRTTIGEQSFIGSNATLVAPLDIGPGAYIAAGSVITENVPGDALGVGRSRQSNKEGWAKRRRGRPAKP